MLLFTFIRRTIVAHKKRCGQYFFFAVHGLRNYSQYGNIAIFGRALRIFDVTDPLDDTDLVR